MPRIPKLFKLLGIDHVVIASSDRHAAKELFLRIGCIPYTFQDRSTAIQPFDADELEQYWGCGLSYGAVHFVLIDPTVRRYISAKVEEFLNSHGEIQVFSVAVLVDNALRVKEELACRGYPATLLWHQGDLFGPFLRLGLKLPIESAFDWEFVERFSAREYDIKNASSSIPTGIDHFAVAVGSLEPWKRMYSGLGFQKVYAPHSEIGGTFSSMKTVAMRRDNLAVALVEGVDGERLSQVTRYLYEHREHSVQHIALRFEHLLNAIAALRERGVKFRVHRERGDDTAVEVDDIILHGVDHFGPLFQSFTRPLTANGLFWELIQRTSKRRLSSSSAQEFDDDNVRRLYRMIEMAEERGGEPLILS